MRGNLYGYSDFFDGSSLVQESTEQSESVELRRYLQLAESLGELTDYGTRLAQACPAVGVYSSATTGYMVVSTKL
jgi:hypothetical protein